MPSLFNEIMPYAVFFIVLVGIFFIVLKRFRNIKQKNIVIPPLKPPRPPTMSHDMALLKPKPPMHSAHAKPPIDE